MLVDPIVGTQDRYDLTQRKWAALSALASGELLRVATNSCACRCWSV